MNRDLAYAVGLGALSGLLVASAGFGPPFTVILVSFGMLPLFAAGLAFGTMAAIYATVTSAVLIALVLPIQGALISALMMGVPVIVLVRQALLWRQENGTVEWFPPGGLLVWLTGIALAGYAALLLLWPQMTDVQADISARLTEILRDVYGIGEEGANASALAMTRSLPGPMVWSWMTLIVINGLLAQTILVRLRANLRPSPKMADIQLPVAIPLALAASVAIALVSETLAVIGGGLSGIFAVPVLFQGLAVFHVLAARANNTGLILVALYFCMMVFSWLLPTFVILGLVEQWANLRGRISGRNGQEDE